MLFSSFAYCGTCCNKVKQNAPASDRRGGDVCWGNSDYLLFCLYGTRAEGTFLDAGSVCTAWSSKKMFAPKAFSTSLFSMPPRKNASSIRTSHARSVRMTRSWAGAFLAVTSAVRIGTSFAGNSFCIMDSVLRSLANGPSGNGFCAFSCSCLAKASKPYA